MTTLNSAVGELASWSKNLEARIRRVFFRPHGLFDMGGKKQKNI
jgi:hypothetical protein